MTHYRRVAPSRTYRVGHPVFAHFTVRYYAPVTGLAWIEYA